MAHGMAGSMSRVGDCWDNAVAGSFFATPKRELVDDADWRTRDEARTAVFEYIEVCYNQQQRRHASLGYRSPAAYEREAGFRIAAQTVFLGHRGKPSDYCGTSATSGELERPVPADAVRAWCDCFSRCQPI